MSRREDSERRARPAARPSPRNAPPPPGGRARVFSRAALRDVDRLAVEQYGIPSLILMENAARALAEVAQSLAAGGGAGGILVVCGRGNNGGDGLAAARHLHNAGLSVGIVLAAGKDLSPDAAAHLSIARAMGLRVDEAATDDPDAALESAAGALGPVRIVVDALLGTGANRPVTGHLAAMIAGVNRLRSRSGCVVVAADLPSGLDADTGRGLAQNADEADAAVKADITVTFVGPKKGFLALEAQDFLGDVLVRGIGAPAELIERLGQPMPTGEHPGPKRRPGPRPAPPAAPARLDRRGRGVR